MSCTLQPIVFYQTKQKVLLIGNYWQIVKNVYRQIVDRFEFLFGFIK